MSIQQLRESGEIKHSAMSWKDVALLAETSGGEYVILYDEDHKYKLAQVEATAGGFITVDGRLYSRKSGALSRRNGQRGISSIIALTTNSVKCLVSS